MATEAVIWGIHAGQTGDADNLFLQRNRLGVGWVEIGDLSKIEPTRDAFKARFAEVYSEAKPGAIPTSAGQLYRFLYEMKVGDIVAYPSKKDHKIHIGRVEGEYTFEPEIKAGYPNCRAVKWIRVVPRTHFSQGALYEIGSAMSLFQIKNYADEYLKALQGETGIASVENDESVAAVAKDIEETTQDFVLKRLAQELKGHPLADFTAHLLQTMGYRTRISPEGPDGGVDIIAHRDELGFEPPIIKVQGRSTESSIGDPIVSSLYGKVASNEFGLLITLGTFTAQARNFERSKSNLRLIDGQQLVNLILQHYEEFDSRYKGLLPLKRVYVPQPVEEPGS